VGLLPKDPPISTPAEPITLDTSFGIGTFIVTHETAAAYDAPDMRQLPALPEPSARDVIEGKRLGVSGATLGDAFERISEGLRSRGFLDLGVFRVPEADQADGFAIVTKVERINIQTFTSSSKERWTDERIPVSPLREPWHFAAEMFGASPGDFRMFVIVLTQNALEFDKSAHWKAEDFRGLFMKSGSRLDPAVARNPLNRFTCYLLVYHIKRPPEELAHLVPPQQEPAAGALAHAAAAGICGGFIGARCN
jgi:hypothetical protein